jgi:hypothetical protein
LFEVGAGFRRAVPLLPVQPERVLARSALGPQEIEDMIQKEGQAEVRCEFCAEQYRVGRDELAMLIRDTAGSA